MGYHVELKELFPRKLYIESRNVHKNVNRVAPVLFAHTIDLVEITDKCIDCRL